jgi:hypothetical protein
VADRVATGEPGFIQAVNLACILRLSYQAEYIENINKPFDRRIEVDASNLENIVQLLLGCVMLLAGRNIFWLFIALAGFVVGFELAGIWLADNSLLVQVTVALGAGLFGALLAVIFERVAFALAGFYAAAYLALIMIDRIGVSAGENVIIIVSGLVGALIAALVMDWAIIALSALLGAAAIVATFAMPPVIETAVFIVLVAVGVMVQRSVYLRGLSS